MKALSIRQPWAGLIAAGIKTVEFRKRRAVSMVGERFAVHAAKAQLEPSFIERKLARMLDPFVGIGDFQRRLDIAQQCTVYGSILAVVRLTDCYIALADHPDTRQPGYPGERCYSWELRFWKALSHPVRCRGHQGWWNLPADVEAQVLRQLEQ